MTDYRSQCLQKDRQIEELEARLVKLEDDVHSAQRLVKLSDSNLSRVRSSLDAAEGKVSRMKESELAALSKAAQLETQLKKSEKALEWERAKREELEATPPPPREVIKEVAAPSIDPMESPEVKFWKGTAQIVLLAYKTRLELEAEERQLFGHLVAAHFSTMKLRWVSDMSAAKQLGESRVRMASMDEQKRLEQFAELTTLKEQAIVLSREKTVLEQELQSADERVTLLLKKSHTAEEEKRKALEKMRELQKMIAIGAVPNPELTEEVVRELSGGRGQSPPQSSTHPRKQYMGASDIKNNSNTEAAHMLAEEVTRLRRELDLVTRERDVTQMSIAAEQHARSLTRSAIYGGGGAGSGSLNTSVAAADGVDFGPVGPSSMLTPSPNKRRTPSQPRVTAATNHNISVSSTVASGGGGAPRTREQELRRQLKEKEDALTFAQRQLSVVARKQEFEMESESMTSPNRGSFVRGLMIRRSAGAPPSVASSSRAFR